MMNPRHKKVRKDVYCYIVPKSKWPNKVKTIQFIGFSVDCDYDTYQAIGIEVIGAVGVDVNGRKIV